MTFEALKDKANHLPLSPGVYVMKDKSGEVIYVGKAKNLRKRLKSYFTGRVTGKTKVLVEALSRVETKTFIETTYGPTVNYIFKSHL